MNSLFQILTLSWSLQGGVLPDVATASSVDSVLSVGPTFYAEYGFELSYPIFTNQKLDRNGVYFGTALRNEFKKGEESFQFDPIQDTYTFSTGLRWNELTIGFDHVCTHSIESLIHGEIVTQRLFGAMDKFFVRIDGKL